MMPNNFNKKILLQINKKEIDKDIDDVETSILAAVSKINEKLKIQPVNIQVSNDKGSSVVSTKQTNPFDSILNSDSRLDYRDNVWYSIDDILKRLGDLVAKEERIIDKLGNMTGGSSTPNSIPYTGKSSSGGKGKLASAGGVLQYFAGQFKETFNDFDNAMSALAERMMSYGDMLNIAHSMVNKEYFAKMTNTKDLKDVYHALNRGEKFDLTESQTLRFYKENADINAALLRGDRVRNKDDLQILAKVLPAVMQAKDSKGHVYTAEERQDLISQALDIYQKKNPEDALRIARILAHDNENAVAMYMDRALFNRYNQEQTVKVKTTDNQGKPVEVSKTLSQVSADSTPDAHKLSDTTHDSSILNKTLNRAATGKTANEAISYQENKNDLQRRNWNEVVGIDGRVAMQTQYNADAKLLGTVGKSLASIVALGVSVELIRRYFKGGRDDPPEDPPSPPSGGGAPVTEQKLLPAPPKQLLLPPPKNIHESRWNRWLHAFMEAGAMAGTANNPLAMENVRITFDEKLTDKQRGEAYKDAADYDRQISPYRTAAFLSAPFAPLAPLAFSGEAGFGGLSFGGRLALPAFSGVTVASSVHAKTSDLKKTDNSLAPFMEQGSKDRSVVFLPKTTRLPYNNLNNIPSHLQSNSRAMGDILNAQQYKNAVQNITNNQKFNINMNISTLPGDLKGLGERVRQELSPVFMHSHAVQTNKPNN